MPGWSTLPSNPALEGIQPQADAGYSMARVRDIDEISPGIFVWQTYDKTVKADLFSTAIETGAGTYVVDPIPLDLDSLLGLGMHRKVTGIYVTNANHARAAAEFAEAFSVPIYVHDALRGTADFPSAIALREGEMFAPGLTGIMLDGGPAGEMALYCHENGGTMVIGDALINFEPHGFCLLPAKYCLDARLMRRSLRKLLDHAFDRMLFAHGTPILSGARERVEQLLGALR
jgi:Metallo-beta-lactamase superfamily